MKVDAWHLPWGKETVPHGVLDIIRGCNISCDACYNSRPDSVRSLPEIESDLRALLSHRQLGSVTIAGGEVLLHPELSAVIRLAKGHGLGVELITNGVLLDDTRLADLKRAGTDVIFLHLESGQVRPDLPRGASRDRLRVLWEEKTAMVAKHDIDVGLTMTAFEERLDEVRDMVDFVVDSPCVNYLLVTLYRDIEQIREVRGGLHAGMRGARRDGARRRTDTLANPRMARLMRDEFGFRPFGYLGSNLDADDPRWLSFLVATRRDRRGRITRHSIRPSAFEKASVALMSRLSGAYPMYRRQSRLQLTVQLLLNGLLGGDFFGNLKFLIGSLRRGATLSAKRLLFQCPANVEPDGTVVHCANCPDAVVQGDDLAPVCIADRLVGAGNGKAIPQASRNNEP